MTKTQQTSSNKTQKFRSRKCKECKKWFTPEREGQEVCSTICAELYLPTMLTKRKRKAIKAFKDTDKATQARITRTVCHKYILTRDEGQPCISCGSYPKRYEAGHFMSSGGNGNVRYNEKNIHAQCHKCNCYLSGNLNMYRVSLIEKIGLSEVEKLEKKEVKVYSVEELKEIAEYYRQKLKSLVL